MEWTHGAIIYLILLIGRQKAVTVNLKSEWLLLLVLERQTTVTGNPVNLEALKYFYTTKRPKGFFQFEIIINVLVSSFRVIWIPMLWVYCQYKDFNSFGARTVFIRQNLTSTDVKFWRIKTTPALKGSIILIESQTAVPVIPLPANHEKSRF